MGSDHGPAGLVAVTIEITSGTHIGGYHVEFALVITDGGGENIQPGWQLIRAVNAVTNQFPVYQVLTVKYRDPRKIFKGAVYQVIIFPDTANAGIRKESGHDGIMERYRFFWIGYRRKGG